MTNLTISQIAQQSTKWLFLHIFHPVPSTLHLELDLEHGIINAIKHRTNAHRRIL